MRSVRLKNSSFKYAGAATPENFFCEDDRNQNWAPYVADVFKNVSFAGSTKIVAIFWNDQKSIPNLRNPGTYKS